MMRPHCDLCDAPIYESFQRWVEFQPAGRGSHIVHLRSELVNNEERHYCIECWKKILTKALEVLNK